MLRALQIEKITSSVGAFSQFGASIWLKYPLDILAFKASPSYVKKACSLIRLIFFDILE